MWGDEQQRAFEELKKRMTVAPVLALPRADREFILHTDASGQALGAVLCQLDDEGGEHPVAFASRVLRGAELNYGITELEGLAVVWACKSVWPHYLTGSKTVVYTDHAALTYILAQSQSTGRLARWAIALQAFDLELRYRPGRKHHVDALSRDVAVLSSVQGQVEGPDKMELDESQAEVFDDGGGGVTGQQIVLAATVLAAGGSGAVSESSTNDPAEDPVLRYRVECGTFPPATSVAAVKRVQALLEAAEWKVSQALGFSSYFGDLIKIWTWVFFLEG